MDAIIRKLLFALSAAMPVGELHAAIDFLSLDAQASKALGDPPLTQCERNLIRAAFSGTGYDCSKLPDADRVLRADLIFWIASSDGSMPKVGRNGIAVGGARVVGKLDLSNLKMPYPLAIVNSVIEEEMKLSSAEVALLNFSGSKTRGMEAEGMKVSGSADFRKGFLSEGRMHLVRADIGAFLSFDGSKLCADKCGSGSTGGAIVADQIRVLGSVHMRDGFAAHGEVRLLNANIQNNFTGLGGEFINPGGVAVELGGATVGGDVHLNRDDRLNKNFVANGKVVLLGTQIGRDLYLDNAQLAPGSEVIVQRANIKGAYIWTACDKAPVKGAKVDLRDSSTTQVADHAQCWPEPKKLLLDGFRYRRFADKAPRDAATRLNWIHLQENVIADSYQQVARVLSDNGDPVGATDVLIELERDRRQAENPNLFFRFWNAILEWTVAYGYSPWRAAMPAMLIVVIGWFLFRLGYRNGVVLPSDKDAFAALGKARSYMDYRRLLPSHYAKFSAFMYSLDSFVPIVDLGQKKSWLPSATRGTQAGWGVSTGWWLRTYLWFHIAFGWLLTTLVVAGVTGFVKH